MYFIASKQVLVRVHHAGVNPVDAIIRAGHFPYLPPTPYTPGGDLAGVVERVGANVTSVKVGDRFIKTQSNYG